jgi:hypothetical protein
MKRGVPMKDVSSIARLEAAQSRREHFIEGILLSFALITLAFLLVVLSARLLITGYSTYIEAKGGYVTYVDIHRYFTTDYWAGIYGLALRVPDFSELLSIELTNGEVLRQDVFFDCIKSGQEGGNEVYASTSPSIDFSNLQPGTTQMVDDFIGCSGNIQCASNTFTESGSIFLGEDNISGIPFAYTYRYDGNNSVFGIGVLNDSENLVFVTNIESVQRSYNYEKIVNFQMLLPIPNNETLEYYFFTDPYDECPPGGAIGENINSTLSGHVFDEEGNPLENATVNVAGYDDLTDLEGFYNISFVAITGIYNVIATKQNYTPAFTNISINFSSYVVEKNITLHRELPVYNATVNSYVYGYVFDESGNRLSDVNVSLGYETYFTNSSGFYGFNLTLIGGDYAITAVKTSYNNYYAYLNLNSTSYINHNITLISVEDTNLYPYPSGPYSTGPHTTGPYTTPPVEAVKAKKNGEDYWISAKEIKKEVRENTFIEEEIGIYNFKSSPLNIVASLSPELTDFVELGENSLVVGANSFSNLVVTIYGTKPIGEYNGTLTLSGDVKAEIPVSIKVVEKKFPVEALLMELNLFKRVVAPGENVSYRLNLQNLLRDQGYKVLLKIYLTDANRSKIYSEKEESVEILDSLTLLGEINLPKGAPEGDYLLNVDATYLNFISTATTPFSLSRPLYLYSLFGIPLWIFLLIISFLSFMILNLLFYKKYKEKKKRYKLSLDYSALPKSGDRSIRVGNIAETNNPAYYEIDKLSTHCIVAGATGMGKSISAQVFVEEVLMKNIAVIVFDPTAQWSGMLRKCTDKNMLSHYPKFGLKETDARAFKGNVRQVKDAREVIDIKKYISPGQIQIFSLNKLNPGDIDLFVASIVRQIFKSDPEESPTLKVLLVFDEVHRLLSKFGGSGEGFLQVERACREFRKWGIGVMLISQVLSDFVGEIKANINTEVQTRTLEEMDLERIKTKYGESFLKSLVRAEVGVVMFQNADYNRGRPYFINFRPILHNTRRLPDEELDKYNNYNNTVDDLEYQIEQLEAEKIDTFDLKMELKLVKDKVMTGNFSVVEIYLEGLVPRIKREWEKLGKKPKKKEIQLVEEKEIQKSIEEAKKAREKFEKEEAKKKTAEKKEEVKENPEEKQINPLTFDNGIMVSSLKELKSVLPNMDEEIFKIHVNSKKNEIAEWIKQLDEGFAEKIKSVKSKKDMIESLKGFGKEEEKKEEINKEEKRGGEEVKKVVAETGGAQKEKESPNEEIKKREKKNKKQIRNKR